MLPGCYRGATALLSSLRVSCMSQKKCKHKVREKSENPGPYDAGLLMVRQGKGNGMMKGVCRKY